MEKVYKSIQYCYWNCGAGYRSDSRNRFDYLRRTFAETQRRYYVLRKGSFCFAKDRNCCFSQKGINDQNMNLKIIPLRRLKIDC